MYNFNLLLSIHKKLLSSRISLFPFKSSIDRYNLSMDELNSTLNRLKKGIYKINIKSTNINEIQINYLLTIYYLFYFSNVLKIDSLIDKEIDLLNIYSSTFKNIKRYLDKYSWVVRYTFSLNDIIQSLPFNIHSNKYSYLNKLFLLNKNYKCIYSTEIIISMNSILYELISLSLNRIDSLMKKCKNYFFIKYNRKINLSYFRSINHIIILFNSIKEDIKRFLSIVKEFITTISLHIDDIKISHLIYNRTTFLSHNISIIGIDISSQFLNKYLQTYMRRKKPIHLKYLIKYDSCYIIHKYNYDIEILYRFFNHSLPYTFKETYYKSMLKTIAAKYNSKIRHIVSNKKLDNYCRCKYLTGYIYIRCSCQFN